MRDCQLLFEPYSTDQIIEILESKVNCRYAHMPSQVKNSGELKALFFSLIDDLAYTFIAKKVAKQNGDIRVAFDLLKSALELLKKQVQGWQQVDGDDDSSFDLSKVRVTYQTILDVYEAKHGSKIAGTLRS